MDEHTEGGWIDRQTDKVSRLLGKKEETELQPVTNSYVLFCQDKCMVYIWRLLMCLPLSPCF